MSNTKQMAMKVTWLQASIRSAYSSWMGVCLHVRLLSAALRCLSAAAHADQSHVLCFREITPLTLRASSRVSYRCPLLSRYKCALFHKLNGTDDAYTGCGAVSSSVLVEYALALHISRGFPKPSILLACDHAQSACSVSLPTKRHCLLASHHVQFGVACLPATASAILREPCLLKCVGEPAVDPSSPGQRPAA